jgi:hypothetical protein
MYTVEVYAGDVRYAGTDANVAIEIRHPLLYSQRTVADWLLRLDRLDAAREKALHRPLTFSTTIQHTAGTQPTKDGPPSSITCIDRSCAASKGTPR